MPRSRTVLEISTEIRVCKLLTSLGANPIKRGQDGELDREILWGRGRCMWMEFKKEDNGRQRAGQKVWIKYLKASGYEAHFINTFEEAEDLIGLWRLLYGEPTAGRDVAFNSL